MEILMLLVGIFTGSMAQKTQSYCECHESKFEGAYCESIKGKGEQGSCSVKEDGK